MNSGILSGCTITPITSKDVFYVLRTPDRVKQYWPGFGKGFAYSLTGTSGIDDTPVMRFATVNEAARECALWLHRLDIVRVEAITTPGKSTRVEVPLGDKRQTGVAIRSGEGAFAEYWTGRADHPKYAQDITNARVFKNPQEVLVEVQRAAARGMIPISRGDFIGIADITTPSTTTYTETVLA